MAKVRSITETFDTSSVDSTKWTVTNGSGTMSQTGGQLVINLAGGLSSYTSDEYMSVNTYDLTNSQFVIEVPQFPNPYQGAEQKVLLLLDFDNYIRFAADGYYYNLELTTGGIGNAGYIDPFPTTDRWWRIRESGGTIYWDSSANGTTWTNLRSVAATFSLTSLKVVIGAGCWQNVANPGTVKFDNINLPPSVTYRNTAEGQSNGTTVSAANSGGGSGTAFDYVDVVGTVARTFSNSFYMHGTQSYAINPTSTATITFVFDGQSDMNGAQQAYFYFTGYPSANCAFMGTYSTDTKSTMALSSTGAVIIYDDAGQVTASASGVVPLNRWVRFDMLTSIGTTTSNGRIQAKVSLEDNTDVLFSYDSGAAVNVGTIPIESYIYGKLDSTPSIATFYMDDVAYKINATSYVDPVNDQLRRNTAEGQPDGTTLTNVNSGGGSGAAFDTVTVSGTIARTFSNEQKMFGSQSYKIAASASSAIYNRVNTADVYSGAAQMYLYLPTYADANQLFLNIRSAAASVAAFSVNQTGAVLISNAAGSNIVITGASIFPTNQWIRVDLTATVGTSTSNGRIIAQLSTLNSFVPFWTYDSGYTTNTGTVSFAEFRFGKLDTTPNIALFYMDDIAWRPKLADYIPAQSSSPGVAWFVA